MLSLDYQRRGRWPRSSEAIEKQHRAAEIAKPGLFGGAPAVRSVVFSIQSPRRAVVAETKVI